MIVAAARTFTLTLTVTLANTNRSQLEGLLEVVPPPSLLSAPSSTTGLGVGVPRPGGGLTAAAAVAAATPASDPSGSSSPSRPPAAGSEEEVSYVRSTPVGSHAEDDIRALGGGGGGAGRGTDAREAALSGKSPDGFGGVGGVDGDVLDGRGGDWEGGGDEGGGGGAGFDEAKRRCSLVEVSLRASRREASEARRARDAAERTVRQQREELMRLKARVSELERSLEREKEAGKVRLPGLFSVHICTSLVLPTNLSIKIDFLLRVALVLPCV